MNQQLRNRLGAIKRWPSKTYRDLKYIGGIKKAPIGKKRIYYFGRPEHSNLGDLAQCYCIRKFFKDEFSDYDVVEIPSRNYMKNSFGCRDFLLQSMRPKDVVFFQSGYCTQDIGGFEDYMHQAVINDFPNNKLVMLPQTVCFYKKEREELASKVYNSHTNLHFFARDKFSFETAEKMFPDIPKYLYPDIVTTLIGQYDYHNERNGVLFCIRNDAEKYYTDEEIDKLRKALSELTKCDKLDTTIRVEYYEILRNLQQYIESYFEKFSKSKVIITDRYHGTIFSLVAGTPVIVIQTNDHKVKTGVEWFKGIYDNGVFFAETLEEAEIKAKEILENYEYTKNEPYFMKEYYKKLRARVGL